MDLTVADSPNKNAITMATTSMEGLAGGAKIVQIRDHENNVQLKRVLENETDLEAWLRKLSVDFEGQLIH